MMRSPTSFAVVVRRRDGSLHVRERGMTDARKGFAKLPFVRGVASLVESAPARQRGAALLGRADGARPRSRGRRRGRRAKRSQEARRGAIGVRERCSTRSTTRRSSPPRRRGDRTSRRRERHGERRRPRAADGLMLVMMVGFMIALPQAAAAGVNKLLGFGLDVQSPGFQAITGAFKLTIVVGYLLVVRRVFPDIRRVFQYHGAEHKTISTYEAGEPLTVENARAKTTLHPRCGTTFLVMVALVSILVFTAVGGFLPKIHTGKAVARQRRSSSSRSSRSCRSSPPSRSRSSASSRATARRARSARSSGRASSSRRSRPSSPTTTSSRSRSRRSA